MADLVHQQNVCWPHASTPGIPTRPSNRTGCRKIWHRPAFASVGCIWSTAPVVVAVAVVVLAVAVDFPEVGCCQICQLVEKMKVL